MGRDLWGSLGPCPCWSRATQSHLPNLPGCMASKDPQSSTGPTALLWCRTEVRPSEPHCWSERSSHLAKPMDHRDHLQSLWESCAAQLSTAAAKAPICSFTAAPRQLGKRLPSKEQTQGRPRCSCPHKQCKCNRFHTSWKNALTLPQPPLHFPDTSSPKGVTTDRGEVNRRPYLLPSQEHRRQQQTLCPCLFPPVLPSSNIYDSRGQPI